MLQLLLVCSCRPVSLLHLQSPGPHQTSAAPQVSTCKGHGSMQIQSCRHAALSSRRHSGVQCRPSLLSTNHGPIALSSCRDMSLA